MGNLVFANPQIIIEKDCVNSMECPEITNGEENTLEIKGIRVYFEPNENDDFTEWCGEPFSKLLNGDHKVEVVPVNSHHDMLQITILMEDFVKGFRCGELQTKINEETYCPDWNEKSKVQTYDMGFKEQMSSILSKEIKYSPNLHSYLQNDIGKTERLHYKNNFLFGNIGEVPPKRVSASTETISPIRRSKTTQTSLMGTKHIASQTETARASSIQTQTALTLEDMTYPAILIGNSEIPPPRDSSTMTATAGSQTKADDVAARQQCVDKSTLTDHNSGTKRKLKEIGTTKLKKKEAKTVLSNPNISTVNTLRRGQYPVFPCRFYKNSASSKRRMNYQAPKRNRSLTFKTRDLESTTSAVFPLNSISTIYGRNCSPIQAERIRCPSKLERARPFKMSSPVLEYTLDSFNLERSASLPVTINPTSIKHIEYPTTDFHGTNCILNVDCLQSGRNVQVEAHSCGENQNSDSVGPDRTESTLRTVVFCHNSQPMTGTGRQLTVCLCDDCYTKTWLVADTFLTMNSSLTTTQDPGWNGHASDGTLCSFPGAEKQLPRREDCAVASGIPDGLSHQESLELDLRLICETVNNHLLNLKPVDDNLLREFLNTLNQKWMELAADKNVQSRQIEHHLQFFQNYSDELSQLILHSTDPEGNNILHYAYGNDRFDMAEEVLRSKHGPELLITKNKLGHTPLMICATSQPDTNRDWNTVRKTFELGNINDLSSRCGRTALMSAASRGSSAMLKVLLECLADPNLQDHDGSTALMYAAEQGCGECVRLLLRHPDCDPLLRDQDGQTASSIAKATGQKDIEQQIYLRIKKMPNEARRQLYPTK